MRMWIEGAFYELLKTKLGAWNERVFKVLANSESIICGSRRGCIIAMTLFS